MSFLRSNRGSSSILVAMVLVILVVFSVLAVTTSVSNLRLARKNAGMIGMYYSLDSEGERFLHEIRNVVIDGEKKADAAIKAISGGNYDSSGLPEAIIGDIDKTLESLIADEDKQAYLNGLFPKLATYYIQEAINKSYPGSVTDSAADYSSNPVIYGDGNVVLSFNVKRTFILNYEGNDRYLNVILNISDPGNGKKPDDVCAVREWRLWQEPFDYKNNIDLWEGVP